MLMLAHSPYVVSDSKHAGEVFCTAHGGLQGSRAAHTSLQSRMSATVLSFSSLS